MAAFSYSLGGPGDLVLCGCFQGGWVGVKGNCWEMKSMGPCFRPGWARLGLGLAILFAVPTLQSPWKMLC